MLVLCGFPSTLHVCGADRTHGLEKVIRICFYASKAQREWQMERQREERREKQSEEQGEEWREEQREE